MSADCSTNNRMAPWHIPRGFETFPSKYFYMNVCKPFILHIQCWETINKWIDSLTKLGATKCRWVKPWCHVITETSLKVYLNLPYSPLPSPKTKSLLRITCWVQTFLLKNVSSEEGCMSLGANLTETCNFFFKVFEISITEKSLKEKEWEVELSKNSSHPPCLSYSLAQRNLVMLRSNPTFHN